MVVVVGIRFRMSSSIISVGFCMIDRLVQGGRRHYCGWHMAKEVAAVAGAYSVRFLYVVVVLFSFPSCRKGCAPMLSSYNNN